jgi:hypothetical protein
MKMRIPALASIFLAVAGPAFAQTAALDSTIPGVWIGTSQLDPKTPAQTFIWLLFPTGNFTELVQQPGPNTPINLYDSKSNQSSSTGTYTASNGSLNLTPAQGTLGPATYVMSDDHSRMIVKFNIGTSAFLFFRFGNTTPQGGWTGTTNWANAAATSLSCAVPPQGQVANLDLLGPAHWVDVGLAGVWLNGIQPSAANPNPQVSLWLIHPDGSIVIHKQAISATQPMDPNSSAHDVATSTGYLDIFGGGFCFSTNGASDLTGTYSLGSNSTQLNLTPFGYSPMTFKRVGYFNLDGSAHLQ